MDQPFFQYKNNELFVENCALSALAKDYGTPLFVYSAASIRKQFHDFEDALTKAGNQKPLIAFACKANDRLGILQLMNELGAGIDVVSLGEMKRALAVGIAAEKIIFSGVGKSAEEINYALDHNIRQINIESEPELHRLIDITRQKQKAVNIVFRLNPDVEAGTHDKISTGRSEDKFGLSAEHILSLYKTADDARYINPHGISIHIGSNVGDPRYFIPAFKRIASLVEELRSNGHTVSELDLGGGLGITYREEPKADIIGYAKIIADIIKPLGCHLSFEPGKYLVGNCGALISKVIYVKKTAVKNHLIIDGAMNDLIRPALYDAYHMIKPVIQNEGEMEAFDIVGPVCESADTFAKDRLLPPMKEGDLVAIGSAGAYCATMASYYNARVPAAEVLIDGDQVQVINRPQSIEAQIESELEMLRET